MQDDWQEAWGPVMRAVGTVGSDLGARAVAGIDRIEPGTLRRYLEPLEFDCALHHDEQVAKAHGHGGVTAPYTAALSFAMPAMWQPGDATLFPEDSRDAQPARSAVKPVYPDYFPSFSGYFATDIDIDFVRPALVGDRLTRRGARLVSCEPKETRIGRGAFIKIESEVVTETGEVITRMRTGMYLYQSHQEQPA